MNRKSIVLAAVIGLFVIVGGTVAYTSNQNDKKEQDKMAMEKKSEDEAMMKKEESAAMEAEKMAKETEVMKKDEVMEDGDAMSKHGVYVTLAEYEKNAATYEDSKKVYFFHASWCPICQGIEKEINADISKIPAGVTLIKTDFDSSTDLRKKYGVTTQYTFVQVDNNDNETEQWSATSLDSAINGIN